MTIDGGYHCPLGCAVVHLYSSSVPSTPPQPPLDSDGLSRGTKNNVTRSPHGNFFSVSRTFINLLTCEGYEGYHRHYVREPSCTKKESSAHLWLPVAIMLDTCPTSHKLAEKEIEWQKTYILPKSRTSLSHISIHLKNVVEPPDPYSSTSMSRVKIEHINSTPRQSSITVLKQRSKIKEKKTSSFTRLIIQPQGAFKKWKDLV